MSLIVDVRQRLGAFTLEARFEAPGGLIALFGPSGSGKTSLVNVIAGLIRPERGIVSVDGAVLLDTAKGISLPTHKRRIGYVFQEGRLFPHLTVRQNLLYGRWFADAAGRRDDLSHVVGLLGIGHLLERRPGRISGGEKQRVAIGRALLAEPRLLLMDEPLAALDDERKAEIMPYLERLRDESRIPIVYVSHSLGEVARLATAMVVMANGRVVAGGPAAEIIRQTGLAPFAADSEAGALIEARVEAHDDDLELTTLRSCAGLWQVPRLSVQPGSHVRIRVRARDVMVATARPENLSALNIMPGRIGALTPTEGTVVDVRIDCNGDVLVARLTRQSVRRLGLEPGREAYAIVKAVAFDQGTIGGPLRAHDATL